MTDRATWHIRAQEFHDLKSRTPTESTNKIPIMVDLIPSNPSSLIFPQDLVVVEGIPLGVMATMGLLDQTIGSQQLIPTERHHQNVHLLLAHRHHQDLVGRRLVSSIIRLQTHQLLSRRLRLQLEFTPIGLDRLVIRRRTITRLLHHRLLLLSLPILVKICLPCIRMTEHRETFLQPRDQSTMAHTPPQQVRLQLTSEVGLVDGGSWRASIARYNKLAHPKTLRGAAPKEEEGLVNA